MAIIHASVWSLSSRNLARSSLIKISSANLISNLLKSAKMGLPGPKVKLGCMSVMGLHVAALACFMQGL
jgi:hypothetical protein